MPRGPPQDPPQHVAAALVRWQDVVGDHHGDRARVVGDYAERYVRGRVGAVAPTRERLGRGDDRPEEIGVVVAADALEHGSNALEAHAGVDVLGREVLQRTVRFAVVLNENEIPELDEARAPAVDRADVTRNVAHVAGVGAAVHVDLRARPARPRLAHLPEILALEAQDAIGGKIGDARPERRRLVVGRMDGGPELVLRQAPLAGEQLPRPRDRLALVVVAERPVAEHLEEGVMVGIASDLLEVVVLAGEA